jgi:hypothetical protein
LHFRCVDQFEQQPVIRRLLERDQVVDRIAEYFGPSRPCLRLREAMLVLCPVAYTTRKIDFRGTTDDFRYFQRNRWYRGFNRREMGGVADHRQCSLAQVGVALRAFMSALASADTANKLDAVLNPPPPEPAKPLRLSGEPVRLLAMLQREGRLLDFLLEDISGASDQQIGAGVRDIHHKSQGPSKSI